MIQFINKYSQSSFLFSRPTWTFTRKILRVSRKTKHGQVLDTSTTEAEFNLKRLAQFFQVAICFHPGRRKSEKCTYGQGVVVQQF